MSHPASPKFLYPPTRRDAVVDDYHGTPVADPYRWLEDLQDPETHAWLEAQQQLTSALLAAMPTRNPAIPGKPQDAVITATSQLPFRKHQCENTLLTETI